MSTTQPPGFAAEVALRGAEVDGTPARRRGVGPVAEFLLVGGATPFLFPLAWLLRRAIGLDASEYALGFFTFHLAFVVNDPHFAVTYFLFYRGFRGRVLGAGASGGQRARYLLAGIGAPLLMLAWAVAALTTRSAFGLGLLIQLMFLLVGWHYVKQGFGVMLVLAARRGMRFAPMERQTLLAHCLAGWAYAWASPADPGTEVEEKGVVYTTLLHPIWLERLTQVVFLATACALLVVLARKAIRERGLPLVTPATALLCSVWSWSIYSSIDPLVVYVIPALHSIQYLYFVWLLRSGEAREREGPPWFETSAGTRLGILAVSALGLGWVLFHAAPSTLDDLLVARRDRSSAMGATPYFAAIYTFVNIHHFVMDSVIWRRENPETRYLRSAGDSGAGDR
ncbi:MAG: hypothetical protein JOZ69_00300 [Myxococcales bacterium]|nr:hypothetical protein [Myxococcales bacterium]